MLGLAPEKSYAVHGPITLEPGDVLLLYTDGLVEARAPEPRRELWGEERLQASLESLVAEGRDVQRIVAGLFADVDAFRAPGPLQDDITLILVRVR
jgi:sigma-B regulation protein RsbU (phosphoserine phosphatase)